MSERFSDATRSRNVIRVDEYINYFIYLLRTRVNSFWGRLHTSFNMIVRIGAFNRHILSDPEAYGPAIVKVQGRH